MRAVLDACVLYPSVLREILQAAGEAGLFVPLWSDRLLAEWVHAAARLGPGAAHLASAEAAAFAAAFPGGRIAAQPAIEARLTLPDPADRHVLAVAIAGRADAIVTFNARDFPARLLAGEGMQRRDPDGFLWQLQSEAPAAMAAIVETSRARAERLAGRPVTLKSLLKRLRLHRLARALGA